MTKDEALRLALEALEGVWNGGLPFHHVERMGKAITAIKAALEAKDEPVAHSVVAGALFDFMGWLTSREKRLILSSVDEASPAVEAITEFAKKRNLSLKYAEVGYWMEFLSTPPQQEAKDEPVATLEDLEQEIYENTRQFVSLYVMEWMLKRYYTTPPAAQRQCEGCDKIAKP
jgi:hypothetical protein